ncbi:hypothetical protein DPMN_026552 [Dreissena polymorpha]|jgi:hypothetical protein|uniref:CCHC-type domain-containing protein n=2 Tax=Dreissena polymorpha TaxID=45954 RepID=A0A9D3YNL6_DREPO|nr:hypothetical protein DPMN_078328 [Dreissena polymorpha]KAH3863563.1 hypothetical protein DPMN_026552 [Dreissena polymorpha]
MASSPDPDISFDIQRTHGSAHEESLLRENDINECRPIFRRECRGDQPIITGIVHESTPYTGSVETRDASNNNRHAAQQNAPYTRDTPVTYQNDRRFGHGDNVPHAYMSSPHHMHVKPDTYEGSGPFESYVSHFEDCAELSGWDMRTKVLMLSSSLRGTARTYYMSLPEQERRDYRILSSRLNNRFGTAGKHQYMWLTKFEERRRVKDESISSLAHDIRQLAQKAYSEFDHRSQEQLALHQLYKLIPNDMKCRCIDRNCTNIIEAVAVIERYESILGTSTTNIRACNVDTSVESALKQITDRLSNLESRNSPQSVPKKCYGCNSTEHFWKSCPQNMNHTRRQSPHFRHPSGRPQPQSRPQNNHMNMSYNTNRSHYGGPYPHVHQHGRQQNAQPPQEYVNERLLHANRSRNEDRQDSNVPSTNTIDTHTYTRNATPNDQEN